MKRLKRRSSKYLDQIFITQGVSRRRDGVYANLSSLPAQWDRINRIPAAAGERLERLGRRNKAADRAVFGVTA
jgi:hypothetical protein